jgi:hypothetical protein
MNYLYLINNTIFSSQSFSNHNDHRNNLCNNYPFSLVFEKSKQDGKGVFPHKPQRL